MLVSTRRLHLRGIVQGVGMRPHVWRLASQLGLAGWVRNDAEGVTVALRGSVAAIEQFLSRLQREAPPLARIDSVAVLAEGGVEAGDAAPADSIDANVGAGADGFHILDSRGGAVRTAIGADAAVCIDCRGEILDPADRRYRYAFTTCTHCGPRYTIARGLPYDRANTSLAPFPLCAACGREYTDPADRRFHAEATCCPACGPRLALRAIDGAALAGDPLAETVRLLRQGRIVAIKGLGGFHLACDARDAAAVARLRQRKHREAKPFAVMASSLAALGPMVGASAEERALLHSPAAPVVLLDKTASCDAGLDEVAPGVGALGVMLPNTPLQWLLFHQAAGCPAGTAWIEQPPAAAEPTLILVMTSANPQGEPLVIDDDEALRRLAGIADAVLGHDRAIVARADDSVRRGATFIRRGRGYTPQAIKLPHAGPSVLAFGGWFKNTVCVTRGDEAFLSTHIGDLDNVAACGFLDETVARMLALTGIEPQLVAHDRHPDFYSTRAARRFAAERGLPALAVQHHHAHLAAVAAEHGITQPALGLALDGVGLGDDEGDGVSAWGGELLRIDGASFERLGHLAPLALPGGDRAAREPWRVGAAALWAIGRGDEIERRFAGQPAAATVRQMLERGLNCPLTSSAGRLFDAAAGLLGVLNPQSLVQFEAQAAMRLEALAEQYGACAPMPGGWTVNGAVLDLSPLLAALADESDPAHGAACFHATLAAALVDWVAAISAKVALPDIFCESGQANTVRLLGAGGCWLNRRLVHELSAAARRLAMSPGERCRIVLLPARQVPPGDGGLSLGQAWVAMQSPLDHFESRVSGAGA